MKTAIEVKHFDHALWIAKLKSFKNEIINLEESLEEIASTGKKREVFAQVEHFQNQFIVQKSNVNDVLHSLKMDEKKYKYNQIMNANGLYQDQAPSHAQDLAETFAKTFSELKNDFTKFVSKHK